MLERAVFTPKTPTSSLDSLSRCVSRHVRGYVDSNLEFPPSSTMILAPFLPTVDLTSS